MVLIFKALSSLGTTQDVTLQNVGSALSLDSHNWVMTVVADDTDILLLLACYRKLYMAKVYIRSEIRKIEGTAEGAGHFSGVDEAYWELYSRPHFVDPWDQLFSALFSSSDSCLFMMWPKYSSLSMGWLTFFVKLYHGNVKDFLSTDIHERGCLCEEGKINSKSYHY